MSKDKIIAAAKEAEIRKAFVCAIPDTCPDDDNCCHNRKPDGYWVKDEQLERFYAIAFEAGRQAEREECAILVEDSDSDGPDPRDLADAIRARRREMSDAMTDMRNNKKLRDEIESLRQQLASRDAEVAELVAALQMAFDYAIRGKTFPANAQTTALLNAVAIELAKVRKP